MQNSLRKILSIGFLFTSLLGTLNHFVYDWFGQNNIIALFAPINESIWEHIKLLFFPMLLVSIYIHYHYRKEYPTLIVSLLWGILYGSLLIPVLYYTYTGILGFHTAIFDIAIYYISVLAAFCKAYSHYTSPQKKSGILLPQLLILCLVASFWVFTFLPPKLPLFAVP